MIAVDLFAGAGGLSLGLESAGINVVLANEIMSDFAATYRENHPGTNVVNADIHDVDFGAVISKIGYGKGVDLVCGGPPCQGFSTVGKKDRRDPRNSLFYEFLRAVRELDPKFVVFENVSGFKRLYDGQAFAALTDELESLGYKWNFAILEASDFGLPQNRQRTIVLASKKGKPVMPSPEFTLEPGLFGTKTKRTLWDAISDLPEVSPGKTTSDYASAPINDYQVAMRSGTNRLTEHTVANYGEKMLEILSLVPPGGSVNDLPERLRPAAYFQNTYARLWPDRPAPTITRNFGTPSSSRCIHPFQPRALSTREGARLQGFPDTYRFVGGKGSKNLQIGNAVPPVLGAAIGRSIGLMA